MCGRYVLGDIDGLTERFQLRSITLPLMPTFNAAPSQRLPVIIIEPDGERRVVAMRWGLIPRWRKSGQSAPPTPINARSETLAEKPMFRPLLSRNRCIIPANGFYEWQATSSGKQPYFIHAVDQPLFGFAGIYDSATGNDGEDNSSFAIITTAANPTVSSLHERMPVMLRPELEAEWLDPDAFDEATAERILVPYPADQTEAFAVDCAVNNTRNNDPSLIEPVPEARALPIDLDE